MVSKVSGPPGTGATPNQQQHADVSKSQMEDQKIHHVDDAQGKESTVNIQRMHRGHWNLQCILNYRYIGPNNSQSRRFYPTYASYSTCHCAYCRCMYFNCKYIYLLTSINKSPTYIGSLKNFQLTR